MHKNPLLLPYHHSASWRTAFLSLTLLGLTDYILGPPSPVLSSSPCFILRKCGVSVDIISSTANFRSTAAAASLHELPDGLYVHTKAPKRSRLASSLFLSTAVFFFSSYFLLVCVAYWRVRASAVQPCTDAQKRQLNDWSSEQNTYRLTKPLCSTAVKTIAVCSISVKGICPHHLSDI